MKLIERLKDRYNLLIIILIILLTILVLRLSALTIAKGDYYRDISDNRRLKEVSTIAARGEIRDRQGRPLAVNKPSFTAQILKDEFATNDEEDKNDLLLTLTRLLEEDGVDYVDKFPIELNILKYKNEEDYNNEEILPMDKVIEIIINENLLKEILLTSYDHLEYEEHYRFIMAERAIFALEKKIEDIPIIVNDKGGNMKLEYDPDVDIPQWKKDNEVVVGANPIDILMKLIGQDKAIIRKIIDNPISRELVYSILSSKNLNRNIIMEEYSLAYDEDYKEQKRILMDLYSEVTEDTTAKEDFINIFKKGSIKNFLERPVIIVNGKGKEEILMPGQILIDMILEKDKTFPITVELDEDESSVIYNNTGSKNLGEEELVDYILEKAKENRVLEPFILDETIRPLAQDQMINDGINTKISIADDFAYVADNNKISWYEENNIKYDSTPEETFNAFKKEYNIDEKLSKYESKSILLLYELISKQGHMAYQPINIAYGIKNDTVAKIEEGMSEFPGIQVSIEPIREYPEGEIGAHILGYLGKISQPEEINKYVEEKEYSPNDIIGKTGLEESYEDVLRGENGKKNVEVDVFGNTINVLNEKKPTPGDNVYLTIDLELQKATEAALKKTLEKIQTGGVYDSEWGNYSMGTNRRKNRPYRNATSGAAVVIDVKNMDVLSMVSYPAYDPNLFSTGIDDTDWESLFPENEKDQLAPRPLYNVASQTAVQPGSVYKMVTALTGLEKGISPYKKIRAMGYVELGENNKPACWLWNQNRSTHGYENLHEALRDSCNYYFYSLALGMNQRTGEDLGVKIEIEDIIDMSKKLDMDDKTGIEINIPREASGGVPEPHKKILATKNILKNYLNNELEEYFQKDVTKEELGEVIEDIISWLDSDEVATRGQVMDRLIDHGIDPDRVEKIGDIIKFDYLNQAGWTMSDTLNITIGQGESSYTPMQMAKSLAIMVNGGYKRDLSLVDNIKNYNNSKTIYENKEELERIELNDYNHLEDLKKGMLMVSKEGTSEGIFGTFPVDVGTKTGTAENTGINPVTGETYDNFAWFVGFAPYDDPEIAVATLIFQGGSGGYAAPMTRDIIAEYLGLNEEDDDEESLSFDNQLIE